MSALEALIRAAERGEIALKRFEDALARQHAVKVRLADTTRVPPAGLDVVGCTEHQLVASEMAAWR